MTKIDLSVGPAVGEIIFIKTLLDQWKGTYDTINISFYRHFVNQFRGTYAEQYWKFINEYGKLFFSEPPYKLTEKQFQMIYAEDLTTKYNLIPKVEDYSHILCHPTYKHGLTDYIVITTKMRLIPRNYYITQLKDKLFQALKAASQKYKIVIVGERIIEMNSEYQDHGPNMIYTIYDDIIKNIPRERIIDLTVPGLGITVPSIEQIKKDSLIFHDAKFVIVIGFGGHFCIASAVSNVICYGFSNYPSPISESWFVGKTYPKLFISKDYDAFVSEIYKQSS